MLRMFAEWLLGWVVPERVEAARANDHVKGITVLLATLEGNREALKAIIAAVDTFLYSTPETVSLKAAECASQADRDLARVTAQIRGAKKARFDAMIGAMTGRPWPRPPRQETHQG